MSRAVRLRDDDDDSVDAPIPPKNKMAPFIRPLYKAPPVRLPCAPILLLALPKFVQQTLVDVLRNDLVFSSSNNSSIKSSIAGVETWKSLPDEVKLF